MLSILIGANIRAAAGATVCGTLTGVHTVGNATATDATER